MADVRYKNILHFSTNNGVILQWGALEATPEELHSAIAIAFSHIENDLILALACQGNLGPLANRGTIDYEEYLLLRADFEIEEATKQAKQKHTKIRRGQFNTQRPQLVLAMVEAGVRYVCIHPGCSIHENLTIDHKVPLSRGGTDELKNLQFMCGSHNASKSDHLIFLVNSLED